MQDALAAMSWAVLPDDERDLIEAAQGDLTRFTPLYDRYRVRLYAYLRIRVGSDEDAADLTHQVFLRALDALPRYRVAGTPFAAWLFRIARNAVTDHHRRRRDTITWDLLPPTLHPISNNEIDAELLRQEEQQALQALLTTLSSANRDLLVLRFVAGLSVREIAVVVGKNEAATRKHLTRLLRRLAVQWEGQDR